MLLQITFPKYLKKIVWNHLYNQINIKNSCIFQMNTGEYKSLRPVSSLRHLTSDIYSWFVWNHNWLFHLVSIKPFKLPNPFWNRTLVEHACNASTLDAEAGRLQVLNKYTMHRKITCQAKYKWNLHLDFLPPLTKAILTQIWNQVLMKDMWWGILKIL